MKAKICDRCGKFFKISIDTEECYNVSKFTPCKTYRKLSRLDMCPACKIDLERWLKDGSKSSNFKPDKNNGTV